MCGNSPFRLYANSLHPFSPCLTKLTEITEIFLRAMAAFRHFFVLGSAHAAARLMKRENQISGIVWELLGDNENDGEHCRLDREVGASLLTSVTTEISQS